MNLSLVMIGCGAFARRYHVPAIEADGKVRIAVIFDPTPAAETMALAERHGAKLVRTLEEVASSAELRAAFGGTEGAHEACAIVTTPHMLHTGHIHAVLDRGLHVMVDKPFVLRSDDAFALAERARSAGLVNSVAYNRRFDANCIRARELIRQGAIGAPRFIQTVQLGYERSGWFLVPELGGGGPYTGRASHMADLIPWLLGRGPSRLRSRLRSSSPDRSDHGGFIELQFSDLEWQMTCVEEGWHMWDEVRIFGDDGLIELRRPLTLPIGWSLRCLTERMARAVSHEADGTPGGATTDFLAAVRGQGKVACTFADAIPSVRIVEQAFASAREGGTWLDC